MGSEEFLTKFKSTMTIEHRQRKIIKESETYCIKESKTAYCLNFDIKMDGLSTENTYDWDSISY